MKQQKLIAGFCIAALAGCLLGILVQAGTMARWYGDWGLLPALGTLSLGFFFWIAVCTPVAFCSRCGLHAALLTLSLLTSVLFGYVFAARFLGGFLNGYVLSFGLLLLLPSAFAAWLLRAYRDRRGMRILAAAAGILALLFDIRARGFGINTAALLLPLLALYLFSIRQAGRLPGRPA